MPEHRQKAFEFAADLSKQLITLAVAIVGAVVTFFDATHPGLHFKSELLIYSLVLFILSIGFGILSLMALTGNLARLSENATPYDGFAPTFASAQIGLFLIATVAIVGAAML